MAFDDGARLWIDNQLVIDSWRNNTGEVLNQTVIPINLMSGTEYDIKLEYFEQKGEAMIKLSWASETLSKQIIPQVCFSHRSSMLDHFEFDPISDQIINRDFSITITAKDQYDMIFAGYTGTATLSVLVEGSTTAINTGGFSNGKWSQSLSLSRENKATSFLVYDGGKSGASNDFAVISPFSSELIIGVIASIAIAVVTMFIILRWHKITIDDPLKKILPPGWQFYTRPTTAEPPGTIFSINKDTKQKSFVTTLPIAIDDCVECAGKYVNKSTMNVLLRFNGLKTFDITGKGKIDRVVIFEMRDPKGEKIFTEKLYPSFEKWIAKEKFYFSTKEKYYVITEATKTDAINYKLTKQQVEILRSRIPLPKNVLKQESKMDSNTVEQMTYPQKFKDEMRVMFCAQELKLRLVKGKLELLERVPIKGVLEFKEG